MNEVLEREPTAPPQTPPRPKPRPASRWVSWVPYLLPIVVQVSLLLMVVFMFAELMRLRSTPPDAALAPLLQAVAQADKRAADADANVKVLTEEVQALKAKITVQVEVDPTRPTPPGAGLTAAGLLQELKKDKDFKAAVAAGTNPVTPQQVVDALKADKGLQPVFAKAQEP